jgi:hypothetical protein
MLLFEDAVFRFFIRINHPQRYEFLPIPVGASIAQWVSVTKFYKFLQDHKIEFHSLKDSGARLVQFLPELQCLTCC